MSLRAREAIELAEAEAVRLAQECAPGAPAAMLPLELAQRALISAEGRRIDFTLPAFRYRQLIEGLDEIEMTLQQRDQISEFRRRATAEKPWLRA